MTITATYRDETIHRFIEISNCPTIDLDFNGQYLIQVDSKTLEPTGNAIDGRGIPFMFDTSDLKIVKEK